MERRKDSKGRVLKKGESERKDGRYQYRYIDAWKKRQTVYASDLKELREKEAQIQKDIDDGINYAEGKIKVYDFLKEYFDSKKNLSSNTKLSYNATLKMFEQDIIGKMPASKVTKFDAKKWAVRQFESGFKGNTIRSRIGIISPAFDMAVEDGIIKRNPFLFRLQDIIPVNKPAKTPLSKEDQERILSFVRYNLGNEMDYNIMVVLVETGMRVSELCALTNKDIDFKNKKIYVTKQLIKSGTKENGKNTGLHIGRPKTESGNRVIPMSQRAEESLLGLLIRKRSIKTDSIIDGVSGFIVIDENGNPEYGSVISTRFKRIAVKYNQKFPSHKIEHFSPHILRHTFCTNMESAGLNLKSLQYIMGHAQANTTLNTYTHSSAEMAAKHFEEIQENALKQAKIKQKI